MSSSTDLARRVHAEFRGKPESRHIAGEFALIELSKLLDETAPQRVLEIGAGIGTITKLLLTHPKRPGSLTSSEAVPVCLREFEKNLAGVDRAGFRLIASIGELDPKSTFDLVIFDGTLDEEKQYDIFAAGTRCFVEGNRRETREALSMHLAGRSLAINFTQLFPGGKKLKFWSKRRFAGFRLPALTFKPVKGCSIGLVSSVS